MLSFSLKLSYFIGAAGFLLSKVFAARKKNLSTARARKSKYTAHMLADARKDRSIHLAVHYLCLLRVGRETFYQVGHR